MKPTPFQKKILIAGAGLVGLSFALCLKDAEYAIQILENHLPDIIMQPKKNSRPISLSYGSVLLLEALGIWNELKKSACPILQVHVSEQGQFGITHFSAKEQHVPALGYVVSFSDLLSTLYHHVTAQDNAVITPIESIVKINSTTHQTEVIVKKKSENITVLSDLFVAADGTQSTCRDLLHIETECTHSGDTARIYQLSLSENHNHTAYERFTKLGVLAILPLFEKNQSQLVWTITERVTKKIKNWSNNDILQFLQDAFEGRVSIQRAMLLSQFPLQTIIAKKQVAQSAVLMGNAAHTLYPLVAQGFNLGLQDAAVLADELIKSPDSIAKALEKYICCATKHQRVIFSITQTIMNAFNFPLTGCLRGAGLLATDLIYPIKNKLAQRAMGITKPLSRVLRAHHHAA